MFNLIKNGEYPMTLKIGDDLTDETIADWATIMQGTELKAWERMLRFWTAKVGPVTKVLTIGKPSGQEGASEKHYWLSRNNDPYLPEIRLNPGLMHAEPLPGMTTVRTKTGDDLTQEAIENLKRHLMGNMHKAWTLWLLTWVEEYGPVTRIEDLGFTSDPDEVFTRLYWFGDPDDPDSPCAELLPDYFGLCVFDEYMPVPKRA